MKRKRQGPTEGSSSNGVDTSKPTAVFTPGKGRPYTVSVALPGSIIANAQTHDLKTNLAGQVARALAVFCVDEVVIFNDGTSVAARGNSNSSYAAHDAETGYTAFSDPSNFLNHILSYLETPPYLRHALFSYHPNLKTAGSLPSLDMPHHLRQDEWCPYREAVTVASPVGANTSAQVDKRLPSKRRHKLEDITNGNGANVTYATAGIANPVTLTLPEPVPPNVRITVRFNEPYTDKPLPTPTLPLNADAVAPDAPREEGGYYWGYTTRLAESLAAVFEDSPYDDGYDFSVGTSERGETLGEMLARTQDPENKDGDAGEGRRIPRWRHLLIVFGGVAGLEAALRNDAKLTGAGISDVSTLFDAWVNLLDGQGSRTIRTEEALWIGLMGLSVLVGVNQTLWAAEA